MTETQSANHTEAEQVVRDFHDAMRADSQLSNTAMADYRDAAYAYLVEGKELDDVKDGRPAIKKLHALLDATVEDIVSVRKPTAEGDDDGR